MARTLSDNPSMYHTKKHNGFRIGTCMICVSDIVYDYLSPSVSCKATVFIQAFYVKKDTSTLVQAKHMKALHIYIYTVFLSHNKAIINATTVCSQISYGIKKSDAVLSRDF